MIGHLKGTIISKNPPEVILEVGGIGYEVLCPMSTFYQLDNLSEDVLLFTHLVLKRMGILYSALLLKMKKIFLES